MPEDVAILNMDDPECDKNRSRVPSRLLTFSRGFPDAHAFCQDRLMSVQIPGKTTAGIGFAALRSAGPAQ